MASDLNVEYELHFPEDNAYGYYNETSRKWTGMVGMIVNRVSSTL